MIHMEEDHLYTLLRCLLKEKNTNPKLLLILVPKYICSLMKKKHNFYLII